MGAACPNREENLKFCTCTYACDKRGVCCECVAYHRSKNQIPGCFFSETAEAEWNRSERRFCTDCEQRHA